MDHVWHWQQWYVTIVIVASIYIHITAMYAPNLERSKMLEYSGKAFFSLLLAFVLYTAGFFS
jgi:hypothetical protein